MQEFIDVIKVLLVMFIVTASSVYGVVSLHGSERQSKGVKK